MTGKQLVYRYIAGVLWIAAVIAIVSLSRNNINTLDILSK